MCAKPMSNYFFKFRSNIILEVLSTVSLGYTENGLILMYQQMLNSQIEDTRIKRVKVLPYRVGKGLLDHFKAG
jgi:hypothetical protein